MAQKKSIYVTLSPDEIGLLISSLSTAEEYLDDVREIQENVLYSCLDLRLAGMIADNTEVLEKIITDLSELRRKLKIVQKKVQEVEANGEED